MEAGDVKQPIPAVPLEVAFRRNRVDGWRVVSEKSTAWVVKFPDNIVAFSPQCTHLGCAYHWDQRQTQFICPCHNSVFSVDGKVEDGPLPGHSFSDKIEGNKLLLGALPLLANRMKEYLSAANDWLDHRTGLRTAVRTFLYEDIPASSGWHQVFGSVALFLFLIQVFTGVCWRSTTRPRPATLTTACATS